jgi:6-phosphogluconolactonase
VPKPVTVTYRVFENGAAFAEGATAYYANKMAEFAKAIDIANNVNVAFSGGTTPKAIFDLLADDSKPYRALVPWERLGFFFVDERSVPPDDKDSNYGMAKAALLDKVPIEPSQVYRIPGELNPEEAAAKYESAIRAAFRLEGAQMPQFQIVSLGMGDDGHTASLFPHTQALHELGRIAVANQVPQKDTWRLTLTWPVINEGQDVSFLLKGAAKAETLRRVFLGGYDPETLPSQLIRPASGRLTLLLDRDAAALLPKPNADGVGVLEVSR